MSWVIAFIVGVSSLMTAMFAINGLIYGSIYLEKFGLWKALFKVFEVTITIFGVLALVGAAVMIAHKVLYGTP